MPKVQPIERELPDGRRGLRRYMDPRFLKSFLSKANGNRGLERYRRVGITASTSFLSKALTIVIGFVSVPLTVHYLGQERYGVWLTISSLLTWMALSDFGIAGNALVNVISNADGRDDRQTAREYTASAFWALAGIATLIGLIMTLTFHTIPWRGIFRVSSDITTGELHLACALTLVVFSVNMPLSMVNSVYSAYQDGFVANLWGIASNVLALIGLIVVTQFRGGLPALIIATSGTRVVVTVANAGYLFFRRYAWLRPAPSAVRWSKIERLMKLGGKYMVTQLASLGIYQSQPFIISQMLGPSHVPIFVIAAKILTVPVDLSYIATAPFVSAFGEAKARDDWRWIRNAFKNTTLACLGIGIPVTIGIALAGKILVQWLAGPNVVPDWGVISWLGVYTLVAVGTMTAGQLLSGLEDINILAISLSLAAFVTVGLALLLAHPWGLAGVAAGMALAKLTITLPLQGYQVRRLLSMTKAHIKRIDSQHLVA